MRVFITGGSGLTGPAVVSELIAGGHQVTGLARSDAAAARLRALGADTLSGSLEDHDTLTAGARDSDGVVHMAFGGSFSDPDDLIRRDVSAIEALGRGLVASGPGGDAGGKPLIMTSGTFAMATGSVSHEDDPAGENCLAPFRVPGENACRAFAGQGVRSIVMRLAPTVHGPGDYGFIAMVIAAARRNGVSAYIGDGANRWPAIHRLDAAVLYRLALEQAPAGTAVHGAAESAITFATIAHEIGLGLGIPTVSLTLEQAAVHFGDPFMATAFAADAPASGARTRALLDWSPAHPTLLQDMREGDYFSTQPDLERSAHHG